MNIREFFSNIFVIPTPAMILPVIVIGCIFAFFVYYIYVLQPKHGTTEWILATVNKPSFTFFSRRHPMEMKDILPLATITLIFTFLAVFNLGDTTHVGVTGEILVPSTDKNHMNNMYFDEIFHVRTAVEHIENSNPYEISHPPLAKLIISASILIFGESPFGWRVLGALFGVIMLVVMYVFLKNMFGKTLVASCATLLFGFDFMRFVQTRIATIDTHPVLFILLAFFFMYRFITTDPEASFRKSLTSLALSGTFFGLSVAAKWIGFYAGAGLFILYMVRLVQLYLYFSSNEKQGFG